MNKEHIKQLAKVFCSENGIMTVNDQPAIGMAKFLQSMIEKGEMVTKDVFDRTVAELTDKSTVSSAGKEVKTLDECKDIVAVNNGFKDWSEYVYLHPIGRLVMNAVCELYASQFKSSPASAANPAVTDEEIKDAANGITSFTNEKWEMFIQGAKWMREQLTKQ